MEIDESDDILFAEQTRIYNEGKPEYYEHDLEFMNYCNGRIDDVGVSDESGECGSGGSGGVSGECGSDNGRKALISDLPVYDTLDVATRMTVDLKGIGGSFYLFLDNLCKVMDVIALHNCYSVINKNMLKKADCIGGYIITYTCNEGVLYLNTYEFYDYATFYMDVRRVPDRNGEFFEIYNFLTEVFNCEVNSENISITISRI
jgi:hypothetical protein